MAFGLPQPCGKCACCLAATYAATYAKSRAAFQNCQDCNMSTNSGYVIRCAACDAKRDPVQQDLADAEAIAVLVSARNQPSAHATLNHLRVKGFRLIREGK